ncbi:MAG: SGNH/GDSL hydrolase family protein [bacterium]
MQIIQNRGRLSRTIDALNKGAITVGFIGGSITDPRPGFNWPEGVCAWLVEKYPGLRLTVENAAIGATGSDLAVFRAERDLINRGCDIVFIEFAVNDGGTPAEQRMRTREGLVRKLLKGAKCDIVFTYTYGQNMYADMISGVVPATIAEFEQLAEHYQISSVWMALNALQEVQKGRMRWEEWLPDGLHPQFRGSASYAQSVNQFLEKELSRQPSPFGIIDDESHEPLNADNWENCYLLPFENVRLTGPWTIRRSASMVWIDQLLHTAAVGAKLAFDFEGRGLLLGFDFGRSSAEFRYQIDGGEWKDSNRDRPDWCGESGWLRTFLVSEELAAGKHTFELEVVHGDPTGANPFTKYCGTNMDLGLIGIIP